MSDLKGRSLGPYQVLEQLGVGGMATVYKAYHPAMDRYVALKVLPHHMASDASFRERFRREARTIARLEHRYILPVYDVSEADGIPFLVMRYTTGGTLSDLIAAGPIPLARAVELIDHVGEALAYAHAAGVIHRDIKPANILIDRDGTPLLTDFGIAKIIEGTMQLTAEGALIGTPFYMAPEQAQGKPAGTHTDIYALGVVLYEMVTGRRPYIAETPLAVALMHVHDPLPLPRQLNPALPEPLERVILKALAKRPEDRFQTVQEMTEALRGVEAQLVATPAAPAPPAPASPTIVLPETRPAAPAPARSVRWMPWLLATGALALLAAGALFLLPRIAPSGATTVSSTAPAAPATAPAAAPPATAAPSAVPATAPRADAVLFSDTSTTNALVALGETVWVATNGGLVRYGVDGQPRAFSTADGLPFNSTQALVAAPDGTLWAATYGRVAHLQPADDGLEPISSYDATDGLDIDTIYSLLVDPADGSVWAMGESGVRHFDGSRWEPPDVPLDDPVVAGLSGPVLALLRDNDGSMWMGLRNEGLLRWDGARWTRYAQDQGVGNADSYQLLQTRDGTLWAVAGASGLLRFDPAQDRWAQAVPAPDDGYAFAISETADGQLWLATSSGLQQSDGSGASWSTVDVPDGYLGTGAIVQTTDGRFWVGGASTYSQGAWTRLKPAGQMPFTDASRILEASDGRLWALAHYGGPIAIIDPPSLTVERYPLDERIYSVAFTDDASWFGTSNGLIIQRNGAQRSLTSADGLPSDEVRQLLATDTAVWIGTNNGLVLYDLASEQITSVPEFAGGIVEALFQAADGAIWAGSHREDTAGFGLLGRFDGQSWRFWRPGDLPNQEDAVEVTRIGADATGQVWLLTWSSGLYRWDGERWSGWDAQDGAPQATLLALAARGDEMLIGGAIGPSLFRWTEDGWATLPIPALSGAVNDILVMADGTLWLATTDGLLSLSK